MDSNGGRDRLQDEMIFFPGGRGYFPKRVKSSHVIYTLLGVSYLLIVVVFVTSLTRGPKPAPPIKNNDTAVAFANMKSNVQAVSTKAEAIKSACTTNLTRLKSEVSSAADGQKTLRDDFMALQTKIGTLISKMTDLENSLKTEVPANACGEGSKGWEYYGGSCYLFVDVNSNWMAAKKMCETKGASLAVITSEGEQNFIKSKNKKASSARYWIGLTDANKEAEWEWIDGTDYKTSVKFWKEGEPNDSGKNEDCAHIWIQSEWNDVACTYMCYALCEKKASSG